MGIAKRFCFYAFGSIGFVAVLLSGCADRDEVMGRTAGTPVPEPAQNSVHCDLIFPGTDRR